MNVYRIEFIEKWRETLNRRSTWVIDNAEAIVAPSLEQAIERARKTVVGMHLRGTLDGKKYDDVCVSIAVKHAACIAEDVIL